jgi:hypothetical protein
MQSPIQCSNNTVVEVLGEFEYSYGSVSCSVDNAYCIPGGNITVSYTECSGLWNYSNPTFNIFYTPGSANSQFEVARVFEQPASSPRRGHHHGSVKVV